MLDQPDFIISAFWNSVPRRFAEDALSVIFQQYRVAYDTCESLMGSSERKDVIAAMRRGLIETALRDLGKKHDAEVKTLLNRRRTSHYSLLSFGIVDTTASKSGSPLMMPRPAFYRRNIFKKSQATLFDMGTEREGDRLYALLVHGPARRPERDETRASAANPKFPSFARFIFPDQDGKVLTSIDLFKEFRSVVNLYMPPAENIETAEPKPLRIRKKNVE
jgi:hypothetical protein